MKHFRSLQLLLPVFGATALWGCGKPLQLKGVKATQATVENTVSTTTSGTVEPESQAILGFTTPGRVRRIAIKVGQNVKKGQVLAELDNSDLVAIRRNTEQDVSRTRELFQTGLVSRVALDEAERALEVARMNSERSIIRAPFDGIVTDVNLELGELAQTVPTAAKPPVRVIDLKPRTIKGAIDEIDLGKIQPGKAARIRIPAVRQKAFQAEVLRVVPFVSTIKEQDRTSQVEFRVTESLTQLLPAGASADIEVITDRKENALAVPSRVITGTGERRSLFVASEDRIQKRTVKIGVGNYERREVIEGLQAGETVVFPPDDAELTDGARAKVELTPWP